MLKFEFKRSIHNKTAMYIILVNLICFGLGLILPIGLDHVKSITNADFLFSVYTVYTQFGMLIFSFVIAQLFSRDYVNHYLYFYNQFNITLSKNIRNKFLVFISENALCIGLLILISQLLYFHEWKLPFILFGLLLMVIIPYFITVCLFSTVTKNVLMIIGLSLLSWLVSIIFVTFGGFWKYFNVFDASNVNYRYVDNFFTNKITSLPINFYQNIIIEFAILLLLLLIVIMVKSKKWKYEL